MGQGHPTKEGKESLNSRNGNTHSLIRDVDHGNIFCFFITI
jgi:hypothetical protein